MMGSPGSVPAQMVANTFVTQYYNVLHQMPQYAYRFYADASRLARADADQMQIAETQDEIHKVVTSLDHENWQPEIFTVDALNSFGGSVFVLVTGAMHQNRNTRKFVQSFILAPQNKGYYVLNDILRYLDESEPVVDNGSRGMHEDYEGSQMVSNAGPESNDSTLFGTGGDLLIGEESHLPESGKGSEQRGINEAVAYQMNEGFTSANPRALEQISVEKETHSFSAEEASAEKKSYAAILRLQRDSRTSAQRPVLSQQTSSYQPQFESSDQQLLYMPTSHPPSPTEEMEDTPLEVDSRSVYVRNLPPNTTCRQLEDVMRKFGTVRPNSVSVRTNKDGALYAFVDFEDSSSAHAAIEGSPIVVGGRKVYAEGRKSVYLGGARGRRGQARGMYEGNGSQARGSGRRNGGGEATNQGRGVRSARSST
ncbi:hypothetical protein GOP47_0006830 [Adiantum capillus-veneris]|uniref:Uncharacterized protein n=1 Tax=Adiantum capillus-veneris TaxID=13818 RepID=A0A9D4V411_ADICA|nr:hypothetical protein GOP47_0006830 [Adiantum capillus-veneris]